MSNISIKPEMSPVTSIKGLANGAIENRSKTVFPVKILREKLNSNRKKLKDLQKLNALSSDAINELKKYKINADLKATLYKSMAFGLN